MENSARSLVARRSQLGERQIFSAKSCALLDVRVRTVRKLQGLRASGETKAGIFQLWTQEFIENPSAFLLGKRGVAGRKFSRSMQGKVPPERSA